MLTGLHNWIFGLILTLITIGGLFMAAHGGTQDSYYFGLGVSLSGLACLALLIRRLTHKA